MTDEAAALLLLFGGAVIMTNREEPTWGEGWHFPVPDLLTMAGQRFPAIVTQGFTGNRHRGADIMLSAMSSTGARMQGFEPGQLAADGITRDVTRSGRAFAPKGTPILAARDAVVWSVQPSVNGIFVVLDHGKPWATMYGHLETTTLKQTSMGRGAQHVRAGEQIGTMGAGLNRDPSKGLVDGDHLRHLHFEAWYKGPASAAVDPVAAMATWIRTTWRTNL